MSNNFSASGEQLSNLISVQSFRYSIVSPRLLINAKRPQQNIFFYCYLSQPFLSLSLYTQFLVYKSKKKNKTKQTKQTRNIAKVERIKEIISAIDFSIDVKKKTACFVCKCLCQVPSRQKKQCVDFLSLLQNAHQLIGDSVAFIARVNRKIRSN